MDETEKSETSEKSEGSETNQGESSPARLSDVLLLLTELLHLNPTATNRAHMVSGAEFFDRYDDGSSWHNQVVLAVGVSPADPEFAALLRRSEAAGAGAVAVKTHGVGLADASSVVAPFDVAVLVVRDDADWARLATLIRSSALGVETDSVSGVRLGDLYALANTIASIANGATSIVDPVGRILGYSTLSGQPIDDLRRATTLALQEITPPAYDPDFGTVYAARRAIRVPDTVGGMDRLAIAVRAGDELLGTIWTIDPGEERHAEVLDALDQLAPLAGLHLLNARSGTDFGERRNGDLMRTVLEGGIHAALAAAQLGVDATQGFAVAVFTVSRSDRGSLDAVRELHRLLNLVTMSCNLHFAVGHSALIESHVYALFPSAGTDPRRAHSRIAADICESARTISACPVLAAIGQIAGTIDGLPVSKSEAVSTLDLMASPAASSGPSVALFENFRAKLGLREVGGFLATRAFDDDSDLERLRAYDAANHTEYVSTLHGFLLANGNIAATAHALHIHNNTARYRITRLIHEFGLNLDDPDERLWIWLRLSTATS